VRKRKQNSKTCNDNISLFFFLQGRIVGERTHKSHNDNEETPSLKLWSSSSALQKC
jgi:hypothetical protein